MTPHPTPVEVRMLGPLEVGLGDVRLGARDLGGVKPKQLLEVLLLERGRMLAKDAIAERLWGERLPATCPRRSKPTSPCCVAGSRVAR